ncbi:sugar ABC transporter substrate-binding protein [Streptococcus iniae]|uniref:extracellular solute-binding protein n=1 Tax=Streptococcus iniae TaxID=1346 RepID=UPI0008DABA2B|nr:extracellular solute-binding protein [Streptococcus iniae]OHX27154.1 sugar ABC transporter substrate-binding protein [Streptococcus iniae]RLV28060.1 sugar ABC transporter substrate-binding protein [Streptococcus iniae]
MSLNWKKLSVLGLVSLTSLMSLTACGSASKEAQKPDGKTIVVSVDEGYADYINSIKGDFEKENKVTVKVKKEGMIDTLDKLSTDGPTGSAPDVFLAPYDRVGGLGSEGQIAEVSLGNAKDFDETVKNLVSINGKVFGAPDVVETLVTYYNKDLVANVPKTFAELEELHKDPKFAFSSESGKSVGFLAKWTDFYYGYGLIAGHGAYVFGENGTKAKDIGIGNEGSIAGLNYAKQWYASWPQGMQDAKKAGDFITEQFTSKKAGVIIDGPWAAKSFKDAGVNFGVAEIPTLTNGKKYQAFAGGKAWVISNYSKGKTNAQKFLDYVTNAKNQKLFYDKTQEIPANLSARTYASEQGNELTKAVVSQFANAQPMPNIPQMAEVWEPGANMFFNVASGKKDASSAAKEAEKTIKEAIEQKYAE